MDLLLESSKKFTIKFTVEGYFDVPFFSVTMNSNILQAFGALSRPKAKKIF